ncbi:hypothetical protein Tco_0087607 [Tanacetum coccineum]
MGEADINTLTMEQYLALTRGNQAPGVVRPEIRGNINFEIKSQFMRELREDTFSWNKNNDAYVHVERILDIVTLFNIPGVTHGMVMLRVLTITLTGAKKRWVDRLSLGTINTWDLIKKAFTQRSSSRKVSNDSSMGIAAIINELDSIWRDIKKLKENEHAIQVGCENCGGAHLNKECPLHEEYVEESAKKEAGHNEWLSKFQESTEINKKGHDEIIRNLESKEEAEEIEEIKEVAAHHEPAHQKVTPSNMPIVSYNVAPYEPSIPFPRHLEQHAEEALVHKAMESLKRIKVNRPLFKEIRQTDDYAKQIKNLVMNKSRTSENEDVKMNTRCLAIL